MPYGQNTPDNTIGWIGNGALLASRLDANDKPVGGWFNLGQISSAVLALSTEEVEMADTMTGSLGIAKSQVVRTNAEATIAMYSFSPENLALALFGEITQDAAVANATHTFNVKLGRSEVLPGIIESVTSAVLTSDGVTDVTENLVISNGSVFIPADQSGFTTQLAEDEEIIVTYSTYAVQRLEGFVSGGESIAVVYDGINVAEQDTPQKVTWHKLSLSPAAQRELITSDYGSQEITGKLLTSKNVTGTGLSKLFKEETAVIPA